MRIRVVVVVLILLVLPIIFVTYKSKLSNNTKQISNMKLTSPAYKEGEHIPPQFTCKGKNVSPSLLISDVPQGTQSLALILEDPDAPFTTYTHWLLWNISPTTSTITENSIPIGSITGTTSFGDQKYGGPCPPSGSHRYVFKLFALDTTLTAPPEARSEDLEKIMQGHILGQTSLTGIFP